MLKRLVVLAIFLIIGINSFATHLVGGNLGYQYIGTVVVGGVTQYRYKITLTTYTNCGPDANPFFQNEPEPGPLTVGIYEHDVPGVPLGGGNKNLITTLDLVRTDTTKITPELPNSCTIGATTCIFEGVYEAFVNLDLNFTGYHVFYDRCCRNGSIVNLTTPGAEGMGFHAYIGPPLVGNSSPVFTDVPIPFLCVGDTTSLLNTAVDPDGDQLVYSFVDPYAGFSSAGAPAPVPPAPALPWTIPTVGWGGGFNALQPFGAAGYSFIDGATGLTAYYSPVVGDYVVAVEITEYNASGNIVGITRRDLQLLVLNCPPNPAPNIDPAAGTTANNFTVVEGETLCFDFGFNDPNNDSLTLTANGQIFDPLITFPAATIDTPAVGLDTVSATFCWNTACGQAQALPYQFTVSVVDDGCPPKTTNEVFLITVTTVPTPDTLFGPIVVCQGDTATYTTELIAGATYNWIVTGGTVTSTSANTATVMWTSPGTGNVSVSAVSGAGCSSLPIDLDVTVIAAPSADAGPDQFICAGDSVQIGGSPTGPIGATYVWTPNTDIDDNTLANPFVFPTTTTEYIVVADVGGVCDGRDTVNVTVGSITMDAGPDSTICLGDSVQLQATGGTVYVWTPAGTLSDPNAADPFAEPITTTTYTVNITDAAGCTGIDSVVITVLPIPVITISNDTTICDGDCAQLVAGGGTIFNWTPTTGLSDPTIANPLACISTTQTYQVVVGASGCADSAQVTVTVNPAPLAYAGNDTTICENDCALLNGFGGGNYAWLPAASLNDPTLENPTACPAVTTDYELTVTDGNGCTDVDSVQVTVNAAPIVNAGNDIDLCLGQDTTLNATGATNYVWTPITNLSNPNIFNPVASPTVTTTYTVNGTDVNGCTNSDSLVITVNAIPVVGISNDTTICLNDSAQLVASGGTGYSWTPTTGLSNPNIANPMAAPGVNTTYTVVVSNGAACLDSAQVTISLIALPIIVAGPDTAICENECVNLLATGGTSYIWTPVAGLSNASIPNPVACPSATTQYIVSGTDASGCSNTDTVDVVINALPAIDAGVDETICITDSVQLNATGGVSYVWTPITDLSDPNIGNPFASPSATIEYFVTGTDANGCVNIDSMNVIVNALPTVGVSNDTTICTGDTAQLAASGGTIYSWTPTTDLDNPNISNPLADPSVNTTYTVHVIDAAGCEDSAQVTVTLFALPTIVAGPDTALCINECVNLLATGAVSYVWTPTTGLSNATVDNPQACPLVTTQYIVTGTDANTCSNVDTVDVIINALPAVDAGLDETICNTDSVQLNATGAVSYVWTPITDLSDPNIGNPFASPSTTIEYFVTGTDANGCENIDSMTVNVNGLPVITVSNDTTICVGDTAQLLATGGTIYSWTPFTDLDNANIPNPLADPTSTTAYTVHVTDAAGCQDSLVTTVTISPLPTISAGVDETICLNDTVTLNATGGVSYTWSPTDSLSNPNIGNPMAWPIDTTEYIVVGLDALGCSNTDTMNVFVLPLPAVDAGVDVWVCPGDSVQLAATGTGTFTWTPTLGLSNPNIPNPMAAPGDTTVYLVTLTDASVCSNTDSMTVFVNAVVPSDAGPDSTICSGDTIQIGGSPTSVAGSVYSWVPTLGLDDPTVANPFAFPTVTTTYYLNITNDTCSGVDSLTITVNAPPPAAAGADIEICIGDTAQLLATGGITYLWSPSDSLSDPNIDNPMAWPIDTTEYAVLVTDINGCTANDTMFVIVNPLPTVSAGNDTTICLGDSALLAATGGAVYTWIPATDISDPNISNPFVFPAITTEYIVSVVDSNSCVETDSVLVTISTPSPVDAGPDTAFCIGDTVQLVASGSVNYVWTPILTLSDPNIFDPLAFPLDTTTYYVTGTDAVGCNSTDSVTITVNPLPVADAGANTSICDGDTIQLQATGGVTFLWTPPATLSDPIIADPDANPLSTTEYFVSVTDSNGCVANDSITVTVNALPIANAGPDVTACIGDTVGLLATGGTQYTWTPTAFLDNPNIDSPNAFPDTTMDFFVVVTDANSCTSFDTVEVAVFSITVSPTDTSICPGDSVQLNVGGPLATTYIWTPSGGLSDPSIASPMASPATTTTYTVTVNDISGCSDVASATVTVEDIPVPIFTTVIDAGCDGVIVEFTNVSTGADSFLWIFGDGTTSTAVNPTHTFDYGTNFTATLVAYNLFGCSDSASFSGSAGVFEDYFSITIPNVFTPNDDGMNDQFVVSVAGKLYSCIDMKIYNRWGQLMFIASGNNLVWDGRSMAGEKVPNGSYFFTIQIKDFAYQGHITVFE